MSRYGPNRLNTARFHKKRGSGGAYGTQPPGKCTLRHRHPTATPSQPAQRAYPQNPLNLLNLWSS
jgi:hypothetical protein